VIALLTDLFIYIEGLIHYQEFSVGHPVAMDMKQSTKLD
jgi:hypothetical protein